MQAGEGQARLRLPAGGPQHPQPADLARSAVLASSVLLPMPASPSTTSTRPRAGRVDEGREPGELGFAAHDDPGATGRFIRHLFAIPDRSAVMRPIPAGSRRTMMGT